MDSKSQCDWEKGSNWEKCCSFQRRHFEPNLIYWEGENLNDNQQLKKLPVLQCNETASEAEKSSRTIYTIRPKNWRHIQFSTETYCKCNIHIAIQMKKVNGTTINWKPL